MYDRGCIHRRSEASHASGSERGAARYRRDPDKSKVISLRRPAGPESAAVLRGRLCPRRGRRRASGERASGRARGEEPSEQRLAQISAGLERRDYASRRGTEQPLGVRVVRS
jgi:hypothetical protein